jgi:hypothetical protein
VKLIAKAASTGPRIKNKSPRKNGMRNRYAHAASRARLLPRRRAGTVNSGTEDRAGTVTTVASVVHCETDLILQPQR